MFNMGVHRQLFKTASMIDLLADNLAVRVADGNVDLALSTVIRIHKEHPIPRPRFMDELEKTVRIFP